MQDPPEVRLAEEAAFARHTQTIAGPNSRHRRGAVGFDCLDQQSVIAIDHDAHVFRQRPRLCVDRKIKGPFFH